MLRWFIQSPAHSLCDINAMLKCEQEIQITNEDRR